MARLAAEALGCAPRDIQVCSTGVIGAPLPMERVEEGLPRLVQSARADGLPDFARAIMTTDTRPKQRGRWLDLDGRRIAIAGACKGAGMIHPNMATMLGFVLTDAPLDEADLVAVWTRVAGRSFNAISVDGDTSTNDTALCLASGAAGGPPLKDAELEAFERALAEVAGELARDIVRDAEGATKVVAVTVSGAPSEADARRAADAIATSPLVKTALHGEDPNWGRMVAAVGRSGCPIDTARVRVEVGGFVVFQANAWAGAEAEKAAHAVMCTPEYGVALDLGLGDAQFTIFTCDLSADYVRINADYRS
jgi:glutamate N-acetyltransferase/amino-acid N-acetyltransferase